MVLRLLQGTYLAIVFSDLKLYILRLRVEIVCKFTLGLIESQVGRLPPGAYGLKGI